MVEVLDQIDFARVAVLGCSGSGKSTLARTLAQRLDAPWVQLDALYWGPHWQPRPHEEFLADVAAAVAEPRWVVDGNYRATRDIVWPRLTALVWLNFGFVTVFARALRRTLRRGVTREVIFSGNRESLWRTFTSRESILWWVVTSYARRRREFSALKGAGYPGVPWFELRRSREVRRFLDRVPTTGD
jgi:adenylate kinase family enzyme